MTYALDGAVSKNTTNTAAGTLWKHESIGPGLKNAVLIRRASGG